MVRPLPHEPLFHKMQEMSATGYGHGFESAGCRMACRLLHLHCRLPLGLTFWYSTDNQQICDDPFEDGRYFLRGNSQDPICFCCQERRLKA